MKWIGRSARDVLSRFNKCALSGAQIQWRSFYFGHRLPDDANPNSIDIWPDDIRDSADQSGGRIGPADDEGDGRA